MFARSFSSEPRGRVRQREGLGIFYMESSNPKAYVSVLSHDPQQYKEGEEFGGEWENYTVLNPGHL